MARIPHLTGRVGGELVVWAHRHLSGNVLKATTGVYLPRRAPKWPRTIVRYEYCMDRILIQIVSCRINT